ncbi:hypothetical protein EJ02DRAFT_49743 [Clathrospora elynae]|uniref:Zn(2)-C6 fungal-type domain-containing protein n=1 Tax=Clathrospora elynae TaxID=706981 RepID=A0A6A5SAL8_9PLEO|nr:hypothetical protein EJ02DRAFT_49743 [Clathrospora elynae]
MNDNEVKKRKACSACTTVKAKCSPFGNLTGICQRCQRLHKECIFEDSQRKKGPRGRSRMKTLEQRVQTLMGIFETNNSQILAQPSASSDRFLAIPATTYGTPSPDSSLIDSHGSFRLPIEQEESFNQSPTYASTVYDPVAAGLVDEVQANVLLDEYRRSFTQHFPFVVINDSADANTLRHQQPFVFLSIMTTTSHQKPAIQRILGERFKDQVAARISARTLKGLEVLQGLLIHAAYYHLFYMPGTQQLALMMSLCVATAQDIGLSKDAEKGHDMGSGPERSLADQRALLGTYYLAAQFAHMWRNRTTMQYTRSLARHCQSFIERPEYTSDALISPLVRLSDLMCRITEYFSYDEILYSEANGDSALEMSTSNFRNELQRLQDSISDSVRQNTTIRLTGNLTNIWIHECSLHNNLWNPEPAAEPVSKLTFITPTRARMLQRSLSASQTYIRDVISAPSLTLHYMSIATWSGWTYSTIKILKLIFLHDNGASGALKKDNASADIDGLLPRRKGESVTQEFYNMTVSLSATTIRDSAMAAQEVEALPLFQAFLEKLMAAAPEAQGNTDCLGDNPADKSFLTRVIILQQGLLAGLERRIGTHISSDATPRGLPQPQGINTTADLPARSTSNTFSVEQQAYSHQLTQPIQYGEPLDFGYFDNGAMLEYPQMQQDPLDTWMWDLVMEDVNMFNM